MCRDGTVVMVYVIRIMVHVITIVDLGRSLADFVTTINKYVS